MKIKFSRHPFAKYSNFMKIRRVGTKLFNADGQIGITKLTVFFFRNFSNTPKTYVCISLVLHSP